MKKNNILSFFMATALLSLTSCYNDDSSLATHPLPDVSITTADEATTYYVGYLDALEIAPTVTRSDGDNEEGLSYLWEITELPSDSNPEWITLGEERDLNATITNDISTQPYYLRYTVTDTKNGGLQYTKLWKVVVQSAFLDGIVVSDTKDDKTSDLNLIMSKELTVNYGNKADKVSYGILNKANGEPFDQLMTGLTYKPVGYVAMTHVNNLFAVTSEGDAVVFNTEKYAQSARLTTGGLVTYVPDGLKAINVFSAGQLLYMNTTQYIYSVSGITASNFGWYDASASQYKMDNGVVMSATSFGAYSQMVMWYDADKEAFVYGSGSYGTSYGTDWEANTSFDPANVPGLTAIAAGQTTDENTPAFVMKDKSTGDYAIYTFNRYQDGEYEYDDDWNIIGTITPEVPQGARMRYEIPAEGKTLLDEAVSVFFAIDQSILYVATAKAIYAINFAGSTAIVNTTPVYSAASGQTITKAKLYCQGTYMADYGSVGKVSEGASVEELELNKKAVVIALQNGTYDGTVSVVPMMQIGTGKLDATKALSYTGFGKILDFCTTGY